jgi:hypothetical protein
MSSVPAHIYYVLTSPQLRNLPAAVVTFRDELWALNTIGKLLFWVPPWRRNGLYVPGNSLVICREGTTKVDLTQFVHGTEWDKCIDPAFRDAEEVAW